MRNSIRKTSELFGVGDVVALKSGGPKMVIAEIVNARVICYWQTESSHPYCTDLPLICLTLVEEPE